VVAIVSTVVVVLVLIKIFLTLYDVLSTVAVWIFHEIPKVGAAFSALGSGVHAMWNTIQGDFNSMIGFVQGLPGAIARAASGMWDGIWTGFRATLNRLIGMWNALHFTIGGGDFFGQQIPSHTFYVTQLPYFHQGGIVPGSGNVLGVLQGGERIIPRGAAQSSFGGGEVHTHFHIDSGAYIDGPSLDMLANKLVQRWRYAPGT